MGALRDVLAGHVGEGRAPGAVGLVARGDRVEVAAVGAVDAEGSAPMDRGSIFRIASVTKPVTAAAVMVLVDEGKLALDDPVAAWLPELAEPVVVRTPDAAVDDVVPARRAITVADLLDFRAGYGFPSDFSLPAVQPLFSELRQGPPAPQEVAAPDAWMAALGRIPLLRQPGEAWLYNTCSDVLGVLVTRLTGSFADFLQERIFTPLGMVDTGFAVPAAQRDRFTSYYRGEECIDRPDGQWSAVPAFPSGAGGLVSTVDDLLRFARSLLGQGSRILSEAAVRAMTTDRLTAAQRAASELFLEGQGWGLGGSVDVAAVDPWNVAGRYGWVGGSGTSWHVVPSTGLVTILLSQLELAGPTPPEAMRAVWRHGASW